MQRFEFLRQPLLGELAMSWREREKERKRKNAIYSGHLRFCLQPKGSARTPLGPKVHLMDKDQLDGKYTLYIFSYKLRESQRR